jgi:hypothetical protein
MNLADLSDDAVIELAREGGVAWIPALSGMRKIVVAKLNEQQKQRIATILQQSLPLGKPPGQPDSPGRGDQRFFRIQIVSEQHYHSLIILIPRIVRQIHWLNSGATAKAASAIKIKSAQTRRVFSKSARGHSGKNNPPRRRLLTPPAACGSPGSGLRQHTLSHNARSGRYCPAQQAAHGTRGNQIPW